MPGFSLEAPPNLRTSLPDRPISASRGRPGAPSVRSSSIEPAANGRIRRQSCSPSRGRLPNGINHNIGSSVPALNRAYAKAQDNVSPVMYGTKMVERVVNMRKLVPPKQDDKQSPCSNLSGKSSSPDSSGFGRNFSKKSLDMAIRHMVRILSIWRAIISKIGLEHVTCSGLLVYVNDVLSPKINPSDLAWGLMKRADWRVVVLSEFPLLSCIIF